MKKNICVALFLFMLLGGVFGQTRQEYRWILGSWIGTDDANNNFQLVLNDNGTGRSISPWFADDIIFSIVGEELILFCSAGHEIFNIFRIYRINDRRMVLTVDNDTIIRNFSKRN